jgi:hypothetical protein
MTLVQLAVIALLVESVWETAKMIWQEGKFSIEKLGVMVLGIVVCIAASLDTTSLALSEKHIRKRSPNPHA